MIQASDIEYAIKDCLSIIGISVNNCRLKTYTCKSINVHDAGAYVFFDETAIYYVGEADDVARRLLNEHCSAYIGGSEGVVRFLMHYLDGICENRNEWINLDAKGREDFVKAILRDRISKLGIYIVTCKGLGDIKQGNKRVKNKLRARLEECLIRKLKPILNPY